MGGEGVLLINSVLTVEAKRAASHEIEAGNNSQMLLQRLSEAKRV